MTLDNHVSVLILFIDHVIDSSHYPTLQKGLGEISLPKEPPLYAAYGANTVATAQLPNSLIGLLRGHSLIRRVYEGMVPARDYDRINPWLHSKLQEWDIKCMEAARTLKG